MSPMREDLTLSWDSADEIELIKKFLKFHAKRLHCSEHDVLVKMSLELNEGVLDLDAFIKKKMALQVIPKKKKEKPIAES